MDTKTNQTASAASNDRIRRYYDAFDEWGRLNAPAGQFEFQRTMFLLQHYLPTACRVLDLGGGPGRYAIALARRGHRVVLADISPEQIDLAERKIRATDVKNHIERIDIVDAVDLGIYEDASFDAVAALGPFYHFVSEEQRRSAVSEIRRVLRPSGLVFVSFMPPLVGVIGLIERAAADPAQVDPAAYETALDGGVFHNRTDRGFQEGWFAKPDEITGLFRDAGFTRLDLVSIRGLAYGREETILAMRESKPDQFAGIMQALQKSARYPTVIATCGHAVYIGRANAD
jgi:ubiquinone/menaquinone biosynthesis C-methylase UbiE